MSDEELDDGAWGCGGADGVCAEAAPERSTHPAARAMARSEVVISAVPPAVHTHRTAEPYSKSIKDLVGFGAAELLRTHNPRHDDAEDVEADHRRRENGLRHHVAG